MAAAFGSQDRLLQPVKQQHTIRQAGQRIVQRLVLECCFLFLAVGNIRERTGHADCRAESVAHCFTTYLHPTILIVCHSQAVLGDKQRGFLSCQVLPQLPAHFLAFFGVDALLPGVHGIGQCCRLLGVTQDLEYPR